MWGMGSSVGLTKNGQGREAYNLFNGDRCTSDIRVYSSDPCVLCEGKSYGKFFLYIHYCLSRQIVQLFSSSSMVAL